MLGLLLAAIYVGLCTISGVVLETSVLAALNFLWYWYLSWGIVAIMIPVVMFIVGLVMTTDKYVKSTGWIITAMAPLVALILIVKSAMLLIGVWLVITASNSGINFADWDRTKLIVGIIVYIIGLFAFRVSYSNGK